MFGGGGKHNVFNQGPCTFSQITGYVMFCNLNRLNSDDLTVYRKIMKATFQYRTIIKNVTLLIQSPYLDLLLTYY